MKRNINLSVGIPAYNESENIIHLLDSLVSQKREGFTLLEIIVASDGSTDSTVNLVRRYKKFQIKIIEGKKRLGQQVRQNQLLRAFSGDVLAIIEGDILLADNSVLSQLVKPYLEGKMNLGMVIGQGKPLKPEGFYERVLFHGLEFKRKLFASWRGGLNVYTAGGHSMKAVSRQFAERLSWPKHVPEDAYTFFRLKELGFDVVRNPKAQAYMRNVTNFSDRKKQVKKFMSGKKALENFFPKDWLLAEYMISPTFVLKSLYKYFKKEPVWTVLFLGELVTNRIAVLRRSAFSALHDIYSSSKKLVNCESMIGRKSRRLSVSVGIPAYNEENNIGILLKKLLHQQLGLGSLKEIIVVSDGSTDNTEKIIGSFKSKKIKLITHAKRMGQAASQNDITRRARGDVLVLLNADIVPATEDFLDKMIIPFLEQGDVGLVGADTISASTKGFFEHIIAGSHEIKKSIYGRINNGSNIYYCHGRARAMRKELYKKINWSGNFPEDAYSYIFCLKEGYKFRLAKEAKVIFRSPTSFGDHIRQSIRFMAGKQKMVEKFGESGKNVYKIPFSAYLFVGVRSLLTRPLVLVSYVFVNFLTRLIFLRKRSYSSIWEVSKSSKRVIYG